MHVYVCVCIHVYIYVYQIIETCTKKCERILFKHTVLSDGIKKNIKNAINLFIISNSFLSPPSLKSRI